MADNITNEINTSTPQQEARAKLRDKFLKAVNKLKGEPCHILTYEQSSLTATFSSWKTDGSEILVQDLQTPANVKMESALLRSPDLIAIKFDNPVWICLACMTTSMGAPAPGPQPLYLDIIDMAAISRMTPQQLEKLAEGLAAEEIMRTKRSSAQALTTVVSKASSGLQSKVGLLGQASAFLASASGKSSSSGDHGGYSYEPQSEKYDYLGLKKSILYTLFQAVKAITGGVTILKGQLIKGGGALASTLGKVIAGKGDAVSNLGKKIVSSAALSEKKPISTPVYGPPPTAHLEFAPPSAYGAPTAPAHYTHTAPAVPTGYAAHKYPSHLDANAVEGKGLYSLAVTLRASADGTQPQKGRNKLNGLHAGFVILTPLGEQAPSETLETAHTGHTALDPPPSILHTVYSTIKNVFSTVAGYPQDPLTYQPPPPPQPIPQFKPMGWGAVDSYGEPATADAYADYEPRNPQPQLEYAASKFSYVTESKGLTPEKIQKINNNLKKVQAHLNNNQRSSEVLPKFTGFNNYGELLRKGQIPFLPTPVVLDNEIGVLPAALLPEPVFTTTTTTTTTSTTTTTEKPITSTEATRRKDVKYILRGNKIVQV